MHWYEPDFIMLCDPSCCCAGVLVSAAKRLMPRMNQQELCNTAWALGVLGQLDKDTWQEFCDCVVNTQGTAHCAGVHT